MAKRRTLVKVLAVVTPSPVVVAIVAEPLPVPPKPVAAMVAPLATKRVVWIRLPKSLMCRQSLDQIAAEWR